MHYVKLVDDAFPVGMLRFSAQKPGACATLIHDGKAIVIHTLFDNAARAMQQKKETIADQNADAALTHGLAALVYKNMMTFGTGSGTEKAAAFRENLDAVIAYVAKTHGRDMAQLSALTRDSFAYIRPVRF